MVAWLESNAVFGNDNCPVNFLTADLAIRKPKQFKPATGKMLQWSVKDYSNGNILQSGTANVQADNLVVIPQVAVYKEGIRRVRVSVTDPSVPVSEPGAAVFSGIQIEPNPSGGNAYLSLFSEKETDADLNVYGLDGRVLSVRTRIYAGQNRLPLTRFEHLPGGFYILEINAGGLHTSAKWIKL